MPSSDIPLILTHCYLYIWHYHGLPIQEPAQYILNLGALVIDEGLGLSGMFFDMVKLSVRDNKPIKIHCDSSVWNLLWPEHRLLRTRFSISLFLIT